MANFMVSSTEIDENNTEAIIKHAESVIDTGLSMGFYSRYYTPLRTVTVRVDGDSCEIKSSFNKDVDTIAKEQLINSIPTILSWIKEGGKCKQTVMQYINN